MTLTTAVGTSVMYMNAVLQCYVSCERSAVHESFRDKIITEPGKTKVPVSIYTKHPCMICKANAIVKEPQNKTT
jgi:hypothetical protein